MVTGAVTVCQVYAPTADVKDEDIDAFYVDLQQDVPMAAKADLMIIMGDLNAKDGVGDEYTKSTMGTHGNGERYERGDRLLDFCFVNNMCITNASLNSQNQIECGPEHP